MGNRSVSPRSLCLYEDLVGTTGLLVDAARAEQRISAEKTLGREI
jgi:hypothetical protein